MAVWLDRLEALNPAFADENGLVAVGGSLDPDLLVVAYSRGIFPWSSDPVVSWWSPDPRAVFDLETFHEHKSVHRSLRKWRITADVDFLGVMRGCASPAPGREETWISPDFIAAYGELHRRGIAHSVEVWEERELVGGIYGVALGGYFSAESMFRRRTNASKVALGQLARLLNQCGFVLLDAQVPTPHLRFMGAQAIPRAQFLKRLQQALKVKARFSGQPGEVLA